METQENRHLIDVRTEKKKIRYFYGTVWSMAKTLDGLNRFVTKLWFQRLAVSKYIDFNFWRLTLYTYTVFVVETLSKVVFKTDFHINNVQRSSASGVEPRSFGDYHSLPYQLSELAGLHRRPDVTLWKLFRRLPGDRIP